MRRLLYIGGLAALCLCMVLLLSVSLLYNSKIQTALVRIATEELSKKCNTTFRIADIRYHFPARVTIHDVYVEDLAGDTLLYVGEFSFFFQPLFLKDKTVSFENIKLTRVKGRFHTMEDGSMNYDFLIPLIRGQQVKKFEWDLPLSFNIDRTILEDADIRYNDYEISLHHLYLHLKQFFNNNIDIALSSIKGGIKHGNERVDITNGCFHIISSDSIIRIPKLALKTNRSQIALSDISLAISPSNLTNVFSNPFFLNNVQNIPMEGKVDKFLFNISDLAFILPIMRDIHSLIDCKVSCHGNLSDLHLDNIDFSVDEKNGLKGKIRLINLLEIPRCKIEADIDNLFVNLADIQDIISRFTQRPVILPTPVQRLQHIQMQGSLSGNLDTIHTRGIVKTFPGNIALDVSICPHTNLASAFIDGNISTRNFNLRQLSGIRQLGKITTSANISCCVSQKGLEGQIGIQIPSFEYNKYKYRNLTADLSAKENKYTLSLISKDDNASFSSSTTLDIHQTLLHLKADMQLNKFSPYATRLTNLLKTTDFSFKRLLIDMSGSHLDDINGNIVLDTIKIQNDSDVAIVEQFEFIAQSSQDYKNFRLVSDLLTGKIEGQLSFKELSNAFQRFAVLYLPGLFKNAKVQDILERETSHFINFYLYCNNIQDIERVLHLPVSIANHTMLKGYVNGKKNDWDILYYSPSISFGNKQLREMVIATDNNNDVARIKISSLYDSTSYQLLTRIFNDTITFSLSSQKSGNLTSLLAFETVITQDNNKPVFMTHISPSQFRFLDTTVVISESDISYNLLHNKLVIKGFKVMMSDQMLSVNGSCSSSNEDSLFINFDNINVRPLMALGVPVEKFSVGGALSGTVAARGVFGLPEFEADVVLDSAHLNESHIGTAYATAYLNKKDTSIIMDGIVINKEKMTAQVTGLFEPTRYHWGIDIASDSVNIGFINHWTDGILSDIDGAVYGNVKVFGKKGYTWVNAAVKTYNAGITIPYTGCRYTLNDSAFMDSTSIRFTNAVMTDEEGNPLYIDGLMEHENFKQFRFSINGRTEHTLSINIPDKEGELIQGKVYSSGNVSIKGDMNEVYLNAKVMTVGQSRFRMSVTSPTEARNNDFISFSKLNDSITHFTIQPSTDSSQLNGQFNGDKGANFFLNLDIEAMPSMLFQLVINDRNGDIIEGRGNGTVKFNWESHSNKMNMTGGYTLALGTFHFTIGNMFRRNFTIGEGSRVIWNGIPQSPELDIIAKYAVTASLKDLFGEEIKSLSKSRTTIPVNACISLKGTLENPIISYFIELPEAEEFVRDQVKSIMSSEEMITKQVIYLLVFGKFFTPEYLNQSGNATNDTYSLLSSTLSGQINAWISKLTKVFSMGVSIRNETDGRPEEYEAQFQIQPIEQLVINGNIGYRYNDLTEQPLFGDIDMEYKITPDGKVRLKAYTHSVDNYSILQATTTQGVGFVFKHDFNWKERKKKEKKRNETDLMIKQTADSLNTQPDFFSKTDYNQ